MNESIVKQFLENALSGINAEKKYGFTLSKIASNKYQSGFYYSIRYKDFETNNWLPLRKSSNTDNEEIAKIFAIDNREETIENYYKNKRIRESKNNSANFYSILENYYTPESKYLKNDLINNKRELSKESTAHSHSFVKNYLIPFLQEQNVKTIDEVTNDIYSRLKIYLQKKIKSTKTINNYLSAFMRILQYFARNRMIEKLPYSAGTGMLRITAKEKIEAKKPEILPIEKLKNCFDYQSDDLYSYLLAMIGLTTGMRNSEIGRIKLQDIIIENNNFILKAYNHKIKFFNTKETDEYRKIPLHPFVVKYLKKFIEDKNPNDYLFGDEEGALHYKKTYKALIQLYKQITKPLYLSDAEIKKDLKEKNIKYYSFRHTFNTLCVLYRFNDSNIDRTDDIIDYFTGHKISNKMRANYTHINKVDNDIFYQNYGKFVIEVLDKFVFADE
jgi:integrase